ncbi:putative secreted hydrolase [Microcystis aeruginosa NIES-2481]|nr:putative secreted hydrolase [Microcystis aeruginosa NIES-2481]
MRFSKALRFRSISILFISIFVALQVHFFPALRPANSEPVTLGTVAAVVALVKAVSASGLARGVCFSGLHMGAKECRKPSRCVEAIERVENIVNTNGSSESVRQLESWIGSASQNENCAISLSRHLTVNVNIVGLTRSAVAELDRLRNPTITSLTSGNALVNAGGKCLDIHAPDMRNNGSRVQVWDCNGQPQQQWSFSGNALVNAGGKCLDIHAPDMRNNGSRVQVWDCNGQPQQQWRF